MKYNIIKLEQQPKGSVHCGTIRSEGKVATYLTRSSAYEKVSKLKTTSPNSTFIVSKHWR